MKDKNKLVYPFTVDTYPLARLLDKKNINVKFAAPEGLALIGKDLSYCVNRQKINKNVISIDEALKKEDYDEILISNFSNYELIKDDISKIVEYSTNKNIEISSLGEIKDFKDIIKNINNKSMSDLQYIVDNLNTINVKYYEDVKSIVIFVVGLFETIDSTLISMLTADYLSDSKYKVNVVSRKKEVILNNGYNYPLDFFESKDISQRIFCLNRFIQALEISESPDIIIFDIPGGFLRNDEFWHNDFGIYMNLIGLAVKPDYIISSIPFNMNNDEFLDGLNKYSVSRFNRKIDVFNITNTLFDTVQHTVDKINKPVYKDMEMIKENIKQLKRSGLDIMCLDNLDEFIQLKTKIINDLS